MRVCPGLGVSPVSEATWLSAAAATLDDLAHLEDARRRVVFVSADGEHRAHRRRACERQKRALPVDEQNIARQSGISQCNCDLVFVCHGCGKNITARQGRQNVSKNPLYVARRKFTRLTPCPKQGLLPRIGPGPNPLSTAQESTFMSLETVTETIKSRVGTNCGLDATLKIDLGDAGAVLINASVVPNTVSNDNVAADCTVGLTLEDFEAMLSGDLAATTAFMSGKLRVEGDMGVAMKLQDLM